MKENCRTVTVLLSLFLCMHMIHEYSSLGLYSFIGLLVVLSVVLSQSF